MANNTKNKVQSFYRIVKAERGHQFAGLYAIEKVYFINGAFAKKEIKHEWDLRIIAEAKLAQLGGQDAYESFKMDNDLDDDLLEASEAVVEPRDPEELKLNKTKLKKELKLDPKVE